VRRLIMGDNESIARLFVNIFDGTRQPIGADTEVSITLTDGNQNVPPGADHRAVQGPTHPFDVDYFDNFGDEYRVFVNASGYRDSGCRVTVSRDTPKTAEVMLLAAKGSFKFTGAAWSTLQNEQPQLLELLKHGVTDAEAEERYNKRMHDEPAVLAAFFNIAMSLNQIRWPTGTPLDYFKELVWDEMKQDRFFAYADRALIEGAKESAKRGELSEEAKTFMKLFHHGSTLSYKQTQFSEADVQITFHEEDARKIDDVDCVKVEPDIDYYKDILAHGFGEVLRNMLTRGLTDPEKVYLLKWTATQEAGLPEFDPPYVISV
jgi:hypothetical protein